MDRRNVANHFFSYIFGQFFVVPYLIKLLNELFCGFPRHFGIHGIY